MNDHRVTKATIKHLLEHPDGIEWTLQGFGMLRCYLEPELRLYVCDARYKADNVSELRTYPWDFHSLVVAGRVENSRYVEIEPDDPQRPSHIAARSYLRQTIRCGEGGGLVGEPEQVYLTELPTERFEEGETYSQLAEEIHASRPEDGTVTVIERRFREDAEHAYVYYEGEWVTAEPRPASAEEVAEITGHALAEWF
jgi:hypothetical protein